MTAETLKPFITPPSVENFAATQNRQRETKITLAIVLSLLGASLAFIMLGFTLWNSTRVKHLQTEVNSLHRVIESMQNRLGLHYLDDLNDMEKDYNDNLINDFNRLPDSDEDVNDDDDDDDDDVDDDDIDDDEEDDDFKIDADSPEYDNYDNYDDMMEKIRKIAKGEDVDLNGNNDDDDDEDLNASDDDNLYVDYEKYKDAKNKNSRKTRSIGQKPKTLPVYEDSLLAQLTKSPQVTDNGITENTLAAVSPKHQPTLRAQRADYYKEQKPKRHIVAENPDVKRSLLRPRGHHLRRRKFPVVKSGESLLSAKTMRQITDEAPLKPAAHFHLNRKVPHRDTVVRTPSYEGDMYIGHPSWTNTIDVNDIFVIEHGILRVTQPGLYYVYAQVCYNNSHDQNGFIIFHGHKPFLQCLQTVPTNIPLKIHTCHTSGLIYLNTDEGIHLRDFNTDRDVVLKDTNNRSYFGLMKV